MSPVNTGVIHSEYGRHFTSYIPLLVYVAFAGVMVSIAYFSYLNLEEGIRKEKYQDLAVLAESKVEQMSIWRNIQRQQSELISHNGQLVDLFDQFVRESSAQNKQQLLQHLLALKHAGGYESFALFDEKSKFLFADDNATSFDMDDGDLIQRAVQTRQLVLSDWHVDIEQNIHLDVLVPLIYKSQLLGVVLLRLAPENRFYSLDQFLISSRLKSAEILLVQRDIHGQLILPDLGYVAHGANKLIIDKQDSNSEILFGTQKNMAILAVVRSLPQTSWNVLVKVDKDELFAPIYLLESWTRFLWSAFALLGGVVFFVWFNGIRVQRDMLHKRKMLIKHFEYLSKYASDLVMVTDLQGAVLEVNERTLSALGYLREELLQMHLEDFCLQPILQTAQSEFHYETMFQCKSGALFAVEVCIRVVDVDGQTCLHTIARDITERKRAEHDLRQQKNFTLQIIDSVPSSIFVTDAQGRFLLVNRYMASLYDLKPEQLIGHMDAELFLNPEQAQQHLFMDKQVIQTGKAVEFVEHNVISGEDVWLQFIKLPMQQDSGSCHVLSVGTNITKLKQAEMVLQQQKKFTLQVIDSVPNFIFVTGADSKLLLANRAMALLHNANQEDLLGRIYTELELINRHTEQCIKADIEVLTRGKTVQFFVCNEMSRKLRWYHVTKVAMEQTAGVAHILNIVVDITERKQLEDMRADIEHIGRLNIAGEMASGLAHELSQPLTACNNYLVGCLRRMADSQWEHDKLLKAVQHAQKQAERAGTIVNHLKSMVKKQGRELAYLDVNHLLKDVLSLLEDEIKRVDITIHLELSDLPKIYLCKVEIEQVLLNLYKNSIESMQNCAVRQLFVATNVVDDERICVVVRDTGKGMTTEQMNVLFSPFHTSKHDGLGLGLVICRSFVEKHDGQIGVNLACTNGAEFWFTLSTKYKV